MDILTSISFWLSIAFLISAAGTIYADYRFGKNLSEQEIRILLGIFSTLNEFNKKS